MLFVKQIGIGDAIASSNPSLDLVKLRETEVVGIFDNDHIGVRDIDSIFDDRGANKEVDVPIVELFHRVLDLVLIHLAMGHAYLRIRYP